MVSGTSDKTKQVELQSTAQQPLVGIETRLEVTEAAYCQRAVFKVYPPGVLPVCIGFMDIRGKRK